MKNRICYTMAILAVLWLNVVSVQAETEIIRLTDDNGYMDILPAVNGNYVVWQGYKGGDWEIFLYDIAAEKTLQITNNDYPDIAPQTDGNYVVWLGMNARGGNIFMYDIHAIPNGQTTQVTDNAKIKSWPQIGDGRIVWSSQEVADSVMPGEIELYDIAAPPGTEPTTISVAVDPDGDLDDHSPLIGNNQVVWVQTGLYENVRASSNRPANNMAKCTTPQGNKNCGYVKTLFIHDLTLTTGATYPAPDDFTRGFGPTRSGNLSITTRFDGHDREIFLNHLGLRRNEQVTDNDVEEKQPAIHGNHLVWVAGQGAAQEIYLGIYQGSFYSQP